MWEYFLVYSFGLLTPVVGGLLLLRFVFKRMGKLVKK